MLLNYVRIFFRKFPLNVSILLFFLKNASRVFFLDPGNIMTDKQTFPNARLVPATASPDPEINLWCNGDYCYQMLDLATVQKNNEVGGSNDKSMPSRFTHFISLPIACGNTTTQRGALSQASTELDSIVNIMRNVHPKLGANVQLQSREKMHLTLLLLNLSSATDIERAREVFNKYAHFEIRKALDTSPTLSFKAVRLFSHGGPQRASVIYLAPQSTSTAGGKTLQTLTKIHALRRSIGSHFVAAGLTNQSQVEARHVLHMTLAKVSKRPGDPKTFDATPAMAALDGLSVNHIQLHGLELSRMDSTDSSSGYYMAECTAEI